MTRIELFNKLIGIINNNNIPYAIVGRTEGYPDSIESDIDIVIPRNRINDFHKNIWSIEDIDTKIVQMFQHEIVAFYYVVFHFDGNNRLFIQPDVCTDYYRKGRKLLAADYLLEGRRESRQGGFYVLSSEKEFLYYLLKKVDKRNLSVDQFVHLRNTYLENKDTAISEASLFWKEEKYTRIIKESFESNNYQLLVNNLSYLQKGIHCTHKKNINDTIENFLLKVKRVMSPTGFVLAFMGPDGSGKTTVINKFKEDIEPAFRRIQQFHLFPIPAKESDSPDTNPQGQKPRNWLLSFLKLLYLLFVYVRGHIRYVIPKKIRSTLTIYDRYYDDILVDPKRYRNGTSSWIVRMVGMFIAEPELWIILDCPTDVIQSRKAEVSPEETERQRFKYLELAKSKKNYIVVNTNRDLKEISLEVCQFVCDSLNRRAIKRYKL